MIFRLAHIVLAFVLFVSSSGLVLNKHYCQNMLKSTAFFLKAEGCHQQKTVVSCPMHAHAGESEKRDCCKDKTEYLKITEDQIASSPGMDLPSIPLVFCSFFVLPIAGPASLDKQMRHYFNYKPPLIVYDRALQFRIFLC